MREETFFFVVRSAKSVWRVADNIAETNHCFYVRRLAEAMWTANSGHRPI